jgi:hypothetical protein
LTQHITAHHFDHPDEMLGCCSVSEPTDLPQLRSLRQRLLPGCQQQHAMLVLQVLLHVFLLLPPSPCSWPASSPPMLKPA